MSDARSPHFILFFCIDAACGIKYSNVVFVSPSFHYGTWHISTSLKDHILPLTDSNYLIVDSCCQSFFLKNTPKERVLTRIQYESLCKKTVNSMEANHEYNSHSRY